jgi:NADH dehydrogenase
MPIRNVAVTGASGFVGRHVVRELIARGYGVRALVRDRAKAKGVLPGGSTLVFGDVNDAASMDDLARGADAMIHLVGIIREAPGGQTFRKMHVDATRSALRACASAGITRYVHMSAIGVSELGEAEYQKSKFEGERLVRESDLDWTIFRPGLIHGPGSAFVEMMQAMGSGLVAPWVFMPYFTRGVEDKRVPLGAENAVDPVTQPVWVEDVAKAFTTALERPETIGEIYNLVGSEALAMPVLLEKIKEGTHGSPHVHPFGVPAKAGVVMAKVAGRLGLGRLLPFDAGMAIMGSQDTTAEREKVRRHLGIATRGFTETFAKYAGAL